MVAPEVTKTAAAMAGKAVVLKVDTERLPALAARYGVQSIPNFVVFTGGRVTAQRAGAMASRELVRMLERPGAPS
jgi:thioredoxin 2